VSSKPLDKLGDLFFSFSSHLVLPLWWVEGKILIKSLMELSSNLNLSSNLKLSNNSELLYMYAVVE
jgi:hypothetical protein